jgi:O-methyltransferase
LRLLKSILRPQTSRPSAPTATTHVGQAVPHWFEAEPDKRALFDELWREYDAQHGEPHDPVRVMMFMHLLKIANAAPDGDYIELGTHRGFTARLIWRLMDASKQFLSFDTFEGFAEPDITIEKQIYANNWTVGNFLPTSPEGVFEYVSGGKPANNLKVIKGWFPQSFAGYEDRKFRFVHIDFDLYQPIKVAMELLWPKVVPGGIMLVHDYGCFGFPGAKKAVDEFGAQAGLIPVPMADRWGSVILAKSPALCRA